MAPGVMDAPQIAHDYPQGNCISDLGKERGEEMVVPCGAFEFKARGALGFFCADDVEGDVAEDGEVLWAVVLAVAGIVLVHGDIEHPMEGVFNSPMGAG